MMNLFHTESQIKCVTNFKDLLFSPFHGEINAICWPRELKGDFSEIVNQLEMNDNMATIYQEELCELELSKQGQFARQIILNDLKTLKAHGASPTLNLIKCYERDEFSPSFPADVYSFHVDRSPIPIDTFLCTYYGEPSEILPNIQAQQKVLVPEIRSELKKLHHGTDESFDLFLSENFFDLHYQAKSNSRSIKLGNGHLWKLAVDYPESPVLPCVHRAPKEKTGQKRLLMIC